MAKITATLRPGARAMADPQHLEIINQGKEAFHAWRKANEQRTLQLDGLSTELRGRDFTGWVLSQVDFSGSDLSGASFDGASVTNSTFRDAKLTRVKFGSVTLTACDLSGADFTEAVCRGGEWRQLKGLHRATGLETMNVAADPRYLDGSERPWLDRWCDWEQLRTFGRMPLFGLSYSVLILIPSYLYLLAWYNHQVDRLHSLNTPGDLAILQQLHKLPMPSRSLILLISTLMLALASTLYTLFCPSRIREFTKDVWCDQLNRSLLNYWPLAWQSRTLRAICGFCYTVGGLGALFVLIEKLADAARYIWEYNDGVM
ncbi:MAG: pentapeptide repeat-containing protein [Gemmataceae bacterium]